MKQEELTATKIAKAHDVDHEQAAKEAGKSVQLIVFKIAEEEYALPIESIKEVVATPSISKLPHSQDYVRGVANIRGDIIAILDLEVKFELKSVEESDVKKSNFTLVIESQEYNAGILVREVPNTLSIGENNIQDAGNLLRDQLGNKDAIKGVIKNGEQLIMLLELANVINEDILESTKTE